MISVIIPVYNAEQYLEDCLQSVCAQTCRELEIIAVDDGSVDSSAAILGRWAEKDPRIRVIHKENGGVSSARNAGLRAARGELISFIDADDTLDPDMYEFLTGLMTEYDADIAHCAYRHIVGEEVRLVHDTKQVYVQDREEALSCLVGSRLFVGSLWNKLYRRVVLEGISFDESLKINEDILYNYLAFKNAKRTVFADVAKYNYIAHLSSSACFVTAEWKKSKDACRVAEIIYRDAGTGPLRTVACNRYLRVLSGYFRTCSADASMQETCDQIRREIWQLSKDNPQANRKMKTTALLIRFAPSLYRRIYAAHRKMRKPNWEV